MHPNTVMFNALEVGASRRGIVRLVEEHRTYIDIGTEVLAILLIHEMNESGINMQDHFEVDQKIQVWVHSKLDETYGRDVYVTMQKPDIEAKPSEETKVDTDTLEELRARPTEEWYKGVVSSTQTDAPGETLTTKLVVNFSLPAAPASDAAETHFQGTLDYEQVLAFSDKTYFPPHTLEDQFPRGRNLKVQVHAIDLEKGHVELSMAGYRQNLRPFQRFSHTTWFPGKLVAKGALTASFAISTDEGDYAVGSVAYSDLGIRDGWAEGVPPDDLDNVRLRIQRWTPERLYLTSQQPSQL